MHLPTLITIDRSLILHLLSSCLFAFLKIQLILQLILKHLIFKMLAESASSVQMNLIYCQDWGLWRRKLLLNNRIALNVSDRRRQHLQTKESCESEKLCQKWNYIPLQRLLRLFANCKSNYESYNQTTILTIYTFLVVLSSHARPKYSSLH